jgi:hypothetical protein
MKPRAFPYCVPAALFIGFGFGYVSGAIAGRGHGPEHAATIRAQTAETRKAREAFTTSTREVRPGNPPLPWQMEGQQ